MNTTSLVVTCRTILTVRLNMRDFCTPVPTQSEVTVKLRPVSKKVVMMLTRININTITLINLNYLNYLNYLDYLNYLNLILRLQKLPYAHQDQHQLHHADQ